MAVETVASVRAPGADPPVVTRSECGFFHVEVLAPSTTDAFFGHAPKGMVMDTAGSEVACRATTWRIGHLRSFPSYEACALGPAGLHGTEEGKALVIPLRGDSRL